MHAEDVVVEDIITVPDYPRRIVGREALVRCGRVTGLSPLG